MKISNILSIGGGCDSFFLSELLGLRFKGPVDNIGSLKGINGILDLFNNKLYNAVINNDYKESLPNIFGHEWPRFIFNDTHDMVHNDFRLEKTKNELLRRFDNFYNYIERAKNDKSLFFIYSTIYNDCINNKEHTNNVINNLPDHIKKRLIIINCYTFNFDINYPIYLSNHNVLHKIWKLNKCKHDNTIKQFNNWWKDNKYFYEELNNCKYDLI